MGGAKFMGRDYGTPLTKELSALEVVWYWFIGGLPLCFFVSILIFPTPNFIVPISVYSIGVVLLFVRYIKIEGRSMTNGKRKT